MKDEDRRDMLRMSDADYRDILNVCAQMPHVTMDHTVEGTYYIVEGYWHYQKYVQNW